MKRATVILTVLVLVGVPLGVLLLARNTADPPHLSVAATERQMRAQLRHMGANDVHCQVQDHGKGVMCSGQRRGSSSTDLYELGTVVTP